MHDRERDDQSSQFAGTQQMAVRGRAPTRLALRLEESFHHEQAAGRDQPEDSRHAGSVKIIEHQNRIKSPQLGPLALEIQHSPIDRDARSGRSLPTPGELEGITIDRNHVVAQFRGSHTVASLATSKVKHPSRRAY